MNLFLISVIVLCTVGSDVLQSFEMKRSGSGGSIQKSAAALFRPLFLLSIVLLALSFFVFLQVLRDTPISFVAPVTASAYVLDGLLARYVLKENVNKRRWLGIGFVFIGVVLISL